MPSLPHRGLAGLLALSLLGACAGPEQPAPQPAPAASEETEPERLSRADIEPSPYRGEPPAPKPEILDARCGWCHATPGPELLPVADWEYVIPKMAENIVTYELGPPISEADQQELLRYYVTNAPDELEPLRLRFAGGGPDFEPALLAQPPKDWRQLDSWPFIAGVNATDLDQDGRIDLLACDVQMNMVTWFTPGPGGWRELPIASATAPARAEPVDADGDGDLDVAVALLGSGRPTDELVGAIFLLINEGSQGFRVRPVAENLPRVADVRGGDFDGDGDLDLVAGIFGGWQVGRVSWFEQVAPLQFEERVLDERNGAINTPVVDIDGDGDLDVFTVLSQHHEEVVAYLNDGAGGFERKLIWKAPHSLWGSSGLVPADLDGDGDTDLVYTNGDAHDMSVAGKPYHGVQWLENRGGLEFEYHDLTRLYGAYGPSVGDLDGDGDLDVVVASQIDALASEESESLIWLQNNGELGFTRRLIARFPHELVATTVGDFTFDGKADVVTGAMNLAPPGEIVSRVTLWIQR